MKDWRTAVPRNLLDALRLTETKHKAMRERVKNNRYGLFTPEQWSGIKITDTVQMPFLKGGKELQHEIQALS